MRAYNLATLMVYINCGFFIMISIGLFDSTTTPDNAYSNIAGFINTEFILVENILEVRGSDIVTAIAILMIAGTALVVNSRAFSSEGVVYGVFAMVFWMSIGITDVILLNITDSNGDPFPGVSLFIGIYTISAFFIFVIAMVQLPTGGQKSHV
jgi:hypothetical protein